MENPQHWFTFTTKLYIAHTNPRNITIILCAREFIQNVWHCPCAGYTRARARGGCYHPFAAHSNIRCRSLYVVHINHARNPHHITAHICVPYTLTQTSVSGIHMNMLKNTLVCVVDPGWHYVHKMEHNEPAKPSQSSHVVHITYAVKSRLNTDFEYEMIIRLNSHIAAESGSL